MLTISSFNLCKNALSDDSFRSSFIQGQHFDVRFVVNRLPTRLQHRACQLAEELSLGPMLFPREEDITSCELPELLYARHFNNFHLRTNCNTVTILILM